MNQYTANTLIQMSVAVTTATGAPISPTTLTLRIETPDGVIADHTADIINTGIGTNYANFLAVQVGLHQYEWTGTGAAQVCTRGQFLINQGAF